jgi:hypothetical protein
MESITCASTRRDFREGNEQLEGTVRREWRAEPHEVVDALSLGVNVASVLLLASLVVVRPRRLVATEALSPGMP